MKNALFPISFASVVVVWVTLLIFFNNMYDQPENAINALNSFFSALAFAGLIIAIFLQRTELSLQRKELADTRMEFELQNKTLKNQLFESTFFGLINVHHSITDRITIHTGPSSVYSNREAIKFVYGEFAGDFLNEYRKIGSPEITKENVESHRLLTIQTFNKQYSVYEEHLSHYVKNLISLIIFVKSSNLIESAEKEFYFEVIRSQLNPHEIVFLFYYLNAGHGGHYRDLFNDLKLGAAIKSSLLPLVSHSFIYDPDHVIDAVMAMRKR